MKVDLVRLEDLKELGDGQGREEEEVGAKAVFRAEEDVRGGEKGRIQKERPKDEDVES